MFSKAGDDLGRMTDQLEHVDRAEYRYLMPATRAHIRGGQKLGMDAERVARLVEHALSAEHRGGVTWSGSMLGCWEALAPDSRTP